MKHSITILLGLTACGFAQTAAVTKNPNDNRLTGNLVMPSGKSLLVEGTLRTNQTPILLGRTDRDSMSGLDAFTSILSSDTNNHGLIVRTTNSAGIPIVGLSETGASAAKFFQLSTFSSPAVWIGRDPATWVPFSGFSSPTLLVTTPSDWEGTPIAEFKKNHTEVVFRIGDDGSVTAPLQTYADSNALVTVSHANQTYQSLTGVMNGSNAGTGQIGEYRIGTAGTVSLVTATAKTVHSISLPAGDWDIEGIATYTKAASTVVTFTQQGISTTNNAMGATGTFAASASAISDVIPSAFTTPQVRLNLTNTTTVYLVANAGFTTSSLSAAGFIRARRVR